MDELAMLRSAITTALNPARMMRRMVDEALAAVPQADGAAIELAGPGGVLTYAAAAGTLAPHVGTRLPVDRSLSGLAMRTGTVQRCDDAGTDTRVDEAACRRLGVASMVCVPLRHETRPVGVLKVSSGRAGVLAGADTSVLTASAEFLGLMLGAMVGLDRLVTRLWRGGPDLTSGLDATDQVDEGQIAAFVANVLVPGASADVAAEARIRDLLDGPTFTCHYQPIVELGGGHVVGHEALARFGGGQRPDRVFAEAHRVGLGRALELKAVESALAGFPPGNGDTYLSVNVGVDTLTSPQLAALAERCQHRQPLVIELTEHEAISDYYPVADHLARLRARGARIAIDDVGSGYASLRHVVDLHPDILKIDRSLISQLDADPARRALATAFVHLAAATGCTVIAEGVEHPAELNACQNLGITYAQGYLLGQPAPIPTPVHCRR